MNTNQIAAEVRQILFEVLSKRQKLKIIWTPVHNNEPGIDLAVFAARDTLAHDGIRFYFNHHILCT